MAAFAYQTGNAALDFGRGCLADYSNFKLILPAGGDQAGLVQSGYHHVAGMLQNELPGLDDRRIDSGA
jgi:hypothetical protein